MMELINWLRIFLSPLLAGTIIGVSIYSLNQNTMGLAAGILIATAGLVIGIIWATSVWKTKGTTRFMSGRTETPALDEKVKEITYVTDVEKK